MADADYRAWVEVLPDFQQFNQNIQSGVIGGFAGAGTSGSAAMGGTLVAGVPKIAGPLIAAIAALGIGSAISNAITSGVDAAVNYIKTSVGLASSLNESINAVTVSYGEQADAVLKLGDNAARTFGLSKLDVNDFAVRFSGFTKDIAGDGGDVAGTLEQIIGRGTDFASVFDLEVAEALQLFQSGLAGETEPLRKYGIDLSAANVAAYAYAEGIAKQGEELSSTQRVQAAFGLLMQETDATSGDFANTQNSLANVMRTSTAEFETTAAELGMELLPIITEIMIFVRDDLMPIWGEFNEVLGPLLRDALEEAMPHLRDAAEAILPALIAVLPLIVTELVHLVGMFGIVAAQVNVAATAVDSFARLLSGEITFDEFVARNEEAFRGVGEAVQSYMDTTLESGKNAAEGLEDEWAKAGSRLGSEASRAGRNIEDGITSGIDGAVGESRKFSSRFDSALNNPTARRQVKNSGQSLIGSFIDGIRSMIDDAGRAVQDVMDWVAGFFPHSPADRGPFAGVGWSDVRTAGTAIMRQFEAGLVPVNVPLSASISSDVAAAGSGVVERPIYMDGSLFGVLRQVANGEARIVLNSELESMSLDVAAGGLS